MSTKPVTTLAKRQLLTIDLIWLMMTIALCSLVLYPIFRATNDYPFYAINMTFIIAAAILVRYIFFLKYSFLAWRQGLKVALIFLSIPLIFNLVNNLNFFVTYIDEHSYEAFLGHLDIQKRTNLATYIRTQMLLFGIGSILAAIFFPIRLVISIWRVRNRNMV